MVTPVHAPREAGRFLARLHFLEAGEVIPVGDSRHAGRFLSFHYLLETGALPVRYYPICLSRDQSLLVGPNFGWRSFG